MSGIGKNEKCEPTPSITAVRAKADQRAMMKPERKQFMNLTLWKVRNWNFVVVAIADGFSWLSTKTKSAT
jgi:hypothetical protein